MCSTVRQRKSSLASAVVPAKQAFPKCIRDTITARVRQSFIIRSPRCRPMLHMRQHPCGSSSYPSRQRLTTNADGVHGGTDPWTTAQALHAAPCITASLFDNLTVRMLAFRCGGLLACPRWHHHPCTTAGEYGIARPTRLVTCYGALQLSLQSNASVLLSVPYGYR